MPTYPVECLSTEEVLGTSVYRWKLHSNWVTEVRVGAGVILWFNLRGNHLASPPPRHCLH